jgi:hypothetical protein
MMSAQELLPLFHVPRPTPMIAPSGSIAVR